jgi:LysM repeat protein
MATSGGGWNWRRTALALVVLAATGVAAVAIAGPETWQVALRDVWTNWLSPRRGADDDVPTELAKSDASPSARRLPADLDADRLPPEEEPGFPDDGLPALQSPNAPRLAARPQRMPTRQLPETTDWEAVPDDEPERPIQLTQIEDDDSPPIVDKPPRRLPQTQAEALPPEVPQPQGGAPKKSPRPVPARSLPAKVIEESGVRADVRSGPRMPLTPLTSIEDKASRSRPLQERGMIDRTIALGDLPTALEELSRWYWRNPDLRESLHPELVSLAEKVYFSPRPHFHEPYVVQPGDRLQSIARKYSVPWEYLCRANKVSAKKIRAGQQLKVVDGPFAAYVSLRNYELIVHHQGAFVAWYRVGVGKGTSTPLGTFTVKEKLVDPTYYGDDGVISHSDPKNPLGERWIDIGNSFGIHGTIEPNSIGKNESRGCIRLINADVEELYDLLSVGSKVTIAE